MYFRYSLEDEGHVITDGNQVLARIRVKTEKLVKYVHHIEFYSGIRISIRPDGILQARSMGVFNERNEQIGSIKPQNDSREMWLEIYDKLVLKNKYAFGFQPGFLRKDLVIKTESGMVIAKLTRRFIPRKLRSFLLIEEEANPENLIFEDRLFIYSLAYVSRRILK